MNRHTSLSNLRHVAIVLSSLVALSSGLSIETAYARGAGGFGGGHFGGLASEPAFGPDHFGGDAALGTGHFGGETVGLGGLSHSGEIDGVHGNVGDHDFGFHALDGLTPVCRLGSISPSCQQQ